MTFGVVIVSWRGIGEHFHGRSDVDAAALGAAAGHSGAA